MKPRFYEATYKAYMELLCQKMDILPLSHKEYISEDVKIISFQRYCEISGATMSDITCSGALNDGYSVLNIRKNLKLILYNEVVAPTRLKHTIMHELGHIRMDHNDNYSAADEIEAHFFATQFLMPSVLVSEIMRRGYKANKQLLMDFFDVSSEAAQKKMDYLLRLNGKEYENELDKPVLQKYKKYIDFAFPE